MKVPQVEPVDDLLGREQTWTPRIPLEDARLKADVGGLKSNPTCLLTSVVPLREGISVPRTLLRDIEGEIIP